jgi:hypothetical protein
MAGAHFVPWHCTKRTQTIIMVEEADQPMRRQIQSAESQTPSKTVGSRTAQIMIALYESGQTTFTHADVESITGLPSASARSLIRHAVARGIVSRLEPGLFVLVPPELGRATEFAGNPYVVARQLATGADYFISHASAMELHRMVTQPQFVIFTSTTKRLRNRTIHGTEFRFILVRQDDAFGVATHWVSKQEFDYGLSVDHVILAVCREVRPATDRHRPRSERMAEKTGVDPPVGPRVLGLSPEAQVRLHSNRGGTRLESAIL